MKPPRRLQLLAAAAIFAALAPPAPPAQAEARLSPEARRHAAVLIRQAEAAINRRAYQKAAGLCEQAIVANPSNARARACLGRAYGKIGNLDKARKYYSAALKIDPDNHDALRWSGMEDLDAGNPKAARQKLRRLGELCGYCAAWTSLRDAIQAGAQ